MAGSAPQSLASTSEWMTSMLFLAGMVWTPLLPALVWGKCRIPAVELRQIGLRSALLTVAVGLPLMLVAMLLFARMDPVHPPLKELLGRSAAVAVGFLPLYGAVFTTNVFQARHRAARARGEAHPLIVRLISGTVILAANLLALLFIFFALFASTGVYRGWR